MNEITNKKGHLHPLTQAIREIHTIFREIGFEVAVGPELETEFYNFDALNVPSDHPARDMQDTFWIKKPHSPSHPSGTLPLNQGEGLGLGRSTRPVLRTHTSPVQVRYMESHTPPFRIIAPGKVFRNEATDATHEAQFFQVEGLVIDTQVSLASLKGTLETFYKKYFGDDVVLRFRPSFFPFTEPSVEVDIKYKNKWLEVMGGGLVHPNVLDAAGIDSKAWQGFAFGGGIDRLVILKYGVTDIRDFYTGDLRFINQF